MTEGVIEQTAAKSEEKVAQENQQLSDKELNFRRLEAARDKEREERIRAEMQAQHLERELENIKTMLTPKEKDPLDEIQDFSELDREKLRAILAQREAQIEKKIEKNLATKFEEFERNKRRANFRDELRRTYNDYDTVMNENVIAQIQEREPEAVEAISAIEDPYVRCEKAYHFFKKRMAATPREDSPSIKEKVKENMQNSYFLPSGTGSPPSKMDAIEFDVRSQQAKKAAYEKLKAAQRRPIGSGQQMHS
jgi:hypothetical protein